MKYKTAQEEFWSNEFGRDYIDRNTVSKNLPSRIRLFPDVLKQTRGIEEIFEFGANIGINLHAIHTISPRTKLKALEINQKAVNILNTLKWIDEVYEGSILEETYPDSADLTFTVGLLIHINPAQLSTAYKTLYETSRKYIMICEYYNPTPISVNYRGHEGRLFKRDFAGEMMDRYVDLKLLGYGFIYHRDQNFPMDDATWFLMQKSL